VTTAEINAVVEKTIADADAQPLFKGVPRDERSSCRCGSRHRSGGRQVFSPRQVPAGLR
jgi:hypothetical protein